MSDIVDKLNEAMERIDEGMGAEAVLKNLRWEQVMYSFFDNFQMLKNMAIDKKNKKAAAAFKSAESMMNNLQKFIDNFKNLEKLEIAARDELSKRQNQPR